MTQIDWSGATYMLETQQSDLAKDFSETPATISDSEIQSELEQILASDSFKGSARCRDFLKHIVCVACSDSPESLKERTIGIAVFGRAPDYDTGADAIVRVKASEVRRRLAQYNQNADPARSIAIELNPGSYTPKIVKRAPVPKTVAATPEKPLKRKWSKIFGIVAGCAVALVIVWMVSIFSNTPLKRFWRPLLGHDKPIICITAPGTYYLSPAELSQRGGDSSEAFPLSKNLQALGRTSRIAIANDVTGADLAVSPVILIGGPKYNRWTQMLTQNLRFSFRVIDNVPKIVDRDNPLRSWEGETSNGRPVEDYAIITRLVATPSHKTVICVAGMKAAGTRIGAKLLFSPEFIEQILKFAPEDWDRKNLQVVVRFMPDKQTYSSEMVAAAYW
jgi:hypothetical protein